MLGHGYKSLERKGGRRWTVTLDAGGTAKSIDAEAVLVAVGRLPLSPNLGLEKVGVELDRGGFIKIDDPFRTTCLSIYAIGDVIRPPLLAHKAMAEGVAAVEIMAGVRQPGFDLMSIAGCIYCEPEVAIVGLTEAQARERGIEVKVGKIPFRVGRGQSDRRLRQNSRQQGIQRGAGRADHRPSCD
jgi:dihydrolipoamide dehydrogenase